MSESDRGRDPILEALENAIFECERKAVGNGRIRKPEKEQVRISYINALANTARVWKELQADADLEEMSEAIQRLKAAQNAPPSASSASGG